MLRIFNSLHNVIPHKKCSKLNGQSVMSNKYIVKDLAENLSVLKNIFGKTDDIKYREFDVFFHQTYKVFVCYLDGIVNENYINVHILKPLMEPNFTDQHHDGNSLLSIAKNKIVTPLGIQELKTLDEVITSVLSGETVLFLDGFDTALSLCTNSKCEKSCTADLK